jgi:hypothetical protein
LINISYSGDPERYVDCGRIESYVKNVRGERNYNFLGSKAQQTYEVMDPNVGLALLDRRMSLEGRVNLIFEETGPNSTKVTANTRYVVSRSIKITTADGGRSSDSTDNVSFNSKGGAKFNSGSTECVATGELEREVLEAAR